MSKASKKKGRVAGEVVELRQKISSSQPPDTFYKEISIKLQNEIDERKLAELALRESEERYRLLYERSPLGYQSLDGEGNLIEVNPAWLCLLGYEKEEVIGRPFADFLSGGFAELIKERFPCFKAAREVCSVPFVMVRKDGSCIDVEIDGKSGYNPDGSFKETHCVLHDVTERKLVEDALRESEELHRVTLTAISDTVFITDDFGVFTFICPNVATVFGYSFDEVEGFGNISKLLGDDFSAVEELGSLSEICNVEREIVDKSGQVHTLLVNIKKVSIKGGTILVTCHDISDRRKAQAALRESEERFNLAVKGANDGIWDRSDLNEDKSWWSPRLYELLGYEDGEIEANFSTLGGLLHPDDKDKVQQAVRDHFEKRLPYNVECRLMTKSGQYRWFHLRGEALRDENGNAIRMTGSMRDITDRKKAEEQLEIAKEHAESANIAKSQFLANMSHEIRTPMSVIMGFASMLGAEELTDEQKAYTELISGAGKSLLRIIDEILDVSRMEAGKLEIMISECSLGKLLDGIEVMMRPLARDMGLGFEVLRSGNLPATIRTDSDRVRQCLINLIGNAIKFTSKGHVYLKVSVAERADGSFVRFDVEDTGKGIASERHESIFKPFEQVDGSDSLKQGGTGLGLTITRQLAQLLGGSLSMASDVGKGSVFSLVIPAGVDAESSSLSAEDEQVRGIGSGLGTADSLTFSGKVLVAEDSQGNQILVERILKRYGLEVVIVDNGKEAVEKAHGGCFDLILMDIQMPGLNGLEATKKLREEGITTPIIALTAFAMADDRKKCLEAGCDDYISKPIDIEKLQQILNRYVGLGENVR